MGGETPRARDLGFWPRSPAAASVARWPHPDPRRVRRGATLRPSSMSSAKRRATTRISGPALRGRCRQGPRGAPRGVWAPPRRRLRHERREVSPAGEPTPDPAEVAACAPYLDLQLAVVHPKVVLAVGRTAARRVSGESRDPRGPARPADPNRVWDRGGHLSPVSLVAQP